MSELILETNTENFELKYFRYAHQFEGDGDDKAVVYGITAQKQRNGVVLEESDSGPVSLKSNEVDNLIHILGRNTVTPMLLCEILDEILN